MLQIIEVTRKLRGKGRILVSAGQKVNFDDVIAKLDYIPGRLIRCDVAFELGCEPESISKYISLRPGEWIEKGEKLVVYDRFYTKRSALSPISGFFVFASKVLGYIFIREPLILDQSRQEEKLKAAFEQPSAETTSKKNMDDGNTIDRGGLFSDNFMEQAKKKAIKKASTAMILKDAYDMKAGFAGVVGHISEGNEITISAKGYRFQGVLGYGQQCHGVITALESETDELQEIEVPDDLQQAIVIIRGRLTIEALCKIEKSGAVGLVAGTIDQDVLGEYCPEEPLISLGHQMEVPMTLILMQGFGASMSLEQFRVFQKFQGQFATIDGNTQLRAGCKRPEILIPVTEEEVDHE